MQPTHRLTVITDALGNHHGRLHRGRIELRCVTDISAPLLVKGLLMWLKSQGHTSLSLNIDTTSIAFLRDFLFSPLVKLEGSSEVPDTSPNLKANAMEFLGTPVLVRFIGNLQPIEA